MSAEINPKDLTASPQELDPTLAETKVLPRVDDQWNPGPRFPVPAGFKRIPEGGVIPDDAVSVRKDSGRWFPSPCTIMADYTVLPEHTNWYFRPIAPTPIEPIQHPDPHGICDDCGRKFHLPFHDDGSIVKCPHCDGESIRERNRVKAPDGTPSNMWKVDPRPLMAEIESLRAQLDASQARVQALMDAVTGAQKVLARFALPDCPMTERACIGELLGILDDVNLVKLVRSLEAKS